MSVKLHAALGFAVRAHSGQDRDGEAAPPYVCHPVEVMLNLRYIGRISDEDLLVVALLHDTLEETPTKVSDIRSAFGERVSGIVTELTRNEPTEEEVSALSKGEIWKLRSSMLLKEIEDMSADAQQVKLADRLSNLREARIAKSPEKYKRYLGQTERILEIIPRKTNPNLWDVIRREVDLQQDL